MKHDVDAKRLGLSDQKSLRPVTWFPFFVVSALLLVTGDVFAQVAESTAKVNPENAVQESAVKANPQWSLSLRCRSRPIVRNGLLYMIADHPEYSRQQHVYCLDAVTGEKKWNVLFPYAVLPAEADVELLDPDLESLEFENADLEYDDESDTLAAVGADGTLLCLGARTGDILWTRSLDQEFGFLRTSRAPVARMVVHEGNLIVSGMACGWGEQSRINHRLLSLSLRTSAVIWSKGFTAHDRLLGLHRPSFHILQGDAQLLIGRDTGEILSVQPRTGTLNWSYQHLGNVQATTAPLVIGNRIVMAVSSVGGLHVSPFV